MLITLQLWVTELWITEFDHISASRRYSHTSHYAYAVSREWPITGGHKVHILKNPWPHLIYLIITFS